MTLVRNAAGPWNPPTDIYKRKPNQQNEKDKIIFQKKFLKENAYPEGVGRPRRKAVSLSVADTRAGSGDTPALRGQPPIPTANAICRVVNQLNLNYSNFKRKMNLFIIYYSIKIKK